MALRRLRCGRERHWQLPVSRPADQRWRSIRRTLLVALNMLNDSMSVVNTATNTVLVTYDLRPYTQPPPGAALPRRGAIWRRDQPEATRLYLLDPRPEVDVMTFRKC